ncbi:MAG TPA: FAD-dependent oxidoreductase [Chthoniobacterales bacterium]
MTRRPSDARTVLVCGGGIVGLSIAYYLGRAGFSVTVVERNSESAGSCAYGSAGYVSPSHVVPVAAPGMVWQGLKWMLSSRSPFYLKPRLDLDLLRWSWLFARSCTVAHMRRAAPVLRDLCLASRQLFVELAEKTGNAFELRTEGLLNLCKTEEGLAHEAGLLGRIANELGIEARVLNAKETAEMESGARLDVVGSIYFPIDAHLTPAKLVATLIALLKEQGVNFHWNTSVVGWKAASGRVTSVSTTAGELVADEYVLATGSWAGETMRGLGIDLPMQPGKGYSLTIERPRFQFTKPMILTEYRVAVTPLGERLRFGGTMELSGHSRAVLPERVEQIKLAAQSYFPDFSPEDFARIEPWFGYRPMSPDGMPYLGRIAGFSNLTAASGHAMLGVTLAPITGLLVAEILSGQRPSIDLSLLNPNRFA